MTDISTAGPTVPHGARMDAEASMRCAVDAVEKALGVDADRPSLVSRIAIDVGAEIIEGLHRPGADLNSVELSRRYDTSRTPVREALLLLEKEGLVTIPPRRRPRVTEYGIDAVRDIYRTRCALLEFIAADVARHATDEDIDLLTGIGERMKRAYEARDYNDYLWANIAFHEHNTVLARNRTVKQIIDSLLLRTLPMRRLSLSSEDAVAASLNEHLHLIRAYRDRDSNLAAALQRSTHLRSLGRLEGLFARMGKDGGAAAAPGQPAPGVRHPA